MKADPRSSIRRLRYLTVSIAIALVIGPSMAFAESTGEAVSNAVWDFHDKVQAVANKSVPGYIEASREGPAPESRDTPFSRDDLNKSQQKYSDLLKQASERAQAQQQLANIDAELLSKLPPNDPRRAALSAELKQVASQMPDTRQAMQKFTNKLAESNAAIDRFNQKNDPAYIPPKKPLTTRAKPPEPVEQGNTDDNSGGGGGDNTDNGADSLRKREAEKEAEARALGKQREAAVNKYLDDPNDANHAEAEAIKARLDGMVDDLNSLRGQVDGIDGVSRPPIHVKSAKAIAKARRLRQQNTNINTNTNGSETNQGSGSGGGGCGVSTGGEHHNPDGSDATGGYQDVGPGGGENANAQSGGGSGAGGGRHHGRRSASHTGGGGRNGGGGQSGVTGSGQYQRSAAGTRGKKQANGASNQNNQNHQNHQGHHQNAGGGHGSNQQAMQQQQRQKQYHPQQQQNFQQQQQQQQQQRKKKRGG